MRGVSASELLRKACIAHDPCQVREALEAGADVNEPQTQEEVTDFCVVPLAPIGLLFLCPLPFRLQDWKKKHECLKLLLEAGADANAIVIDEMPVLFIAAVDGEVFRTLLKYGADPNAKHKDDMLLHSICRGQHSAALHALLDAGVDPNYIDHDGFTALHCCSVWNLAKLLLQYGADPRIKSKGAASTSYWVQHLVGKWTPYHMIPVWTFTPKAFDMYTDHCPGFREGVLTLLLCLLRHRKYVCREVCAMIVQCVAHGHKQEQWWPIVGFSMQKYI